MAALQKIRNHGVLLVTIIGLALAFFVLGDLVRGGEGLMNQSKQQVGEVLGQTLSIQDYNQMVNDIQNYYEILGQNATGEDAQNRIKDEAWQNFVQYALIKDECDKLGIQVTDDEVAKIIQSGQSQMLQIPAFMNPQTGTYDFTQVQTFLTNYKTFKDSGEQMPEEYEKFYQYYLYVQKAIREQLYMQKYQVLMSKAFTANKISAQQAFNDKSNAKDILVAAVPFSSIEDGSIEVSDAEIQAKYNEHKEAFIQLQETRDLKYITVNVTASDIDKQASMDDIQKAHDLLAAAEDNESAGNVVRQTVSLSLYSNVLKSKDAFPVMIANQLDSVAVGATSDPEFDLATNCYYTFRLLDKTTQADSVLFRQFGVTSEDVAKTAEKADSIMTALQGGATFAELSKNYGQSSDSTWISTAAYENSTVDADNALFISSIYETAPGQIKQVKLSNGNIIIIQVLESRNPITKYNVASIIKEGRFSDETYKNEYNRLSSFLAQNKTLDQIEANAAKNGYQVLTANDVTSSTHGIAGFHGTRDALKWAFDEAKVGDVSNLYECGDNDRLLVAALTGITKEGYRPVDKLKEDLKQEVLNDKKAEKLLADLKGKNIGAVMTMKGAVTDSLKSISFASAPYVMSLGSQEPIVGALAAKTAKGQVSAPAKGNAGVMVVQVLNENKSAEKFDEKTEKATLSGAYMRYAANSVINTLYLKADVKDNRYKFF